MRRNHKARIKRPTELSCWIMWTLKLGMNLQTVGLYSSSEDKILTTFLHSAPVLDAAIEDDLAILSAGLDGKIKR